VHYESPPSVDFGLLPDFEAKCCIFQPHLQYIINIFILSVKLSYTIVILSFSFVKINNFFVKI